MAFFINTYLINLSYEEDINKITQRKAVLVEDVINEAFKGDIEDNQKIQEVIDRIVIEDSEIISIAVSKPVGEGEDFEIVASNNKSLIGSKQENNIQSTIAWTTPEGIAFLNRDDDERFWKVTKMIKGNDDEKIGLMSMSLSLASIDALIDRTIRNSYWS